MERRLHQRLRGATAAAAADRGLPPRRRCPRALHAGLQSEAGGTLVTLTDEIELSGIFRLFESLLARMVRRQYGANFGRLKAILEP